MSKPRSSLAHLGQNRPQRVPEAAGETPTTGEGKGASTAPSRAGKSQIGAYFPPEVRRQLKAIAAEEEKTVQQLMGEALNMLFASRGRVEFPDISERD